MIVIPVTTGITVFASDTSRVDTTHVSVRLPASGFAESFKAQKEFDYTKPSVKRNFLMQLYEFLKQKMGKLEKISIVLPWLVRLVFAGLIIFLLIIAVTKTRLYRIFYSPGAISGPAVEISSPDDNPPDLDNAIRQQFEQKQFRLAVRLLYLKLISQLRVKEFILFSQEKTNIDYFRELTDKELKSNFAAVTSIYNHVWYGDVEISEDQYLRFEKSFQSVFALVDVSD